MATIIVTGSAGLVGYEASSYFAAQGFEVVGIDNDMRRSYFGDHASTDLHRAKLEGRLPNYTHHDTDIRDREVIEQIFADKSSDIELVIHAAAQPSHDWAARDAHTDFSVNAVATLNLLEATRRFCPSAAFIFTSTNKVYGDAPNNLPLVEQHLRWEIEPGNPFNDGIDETMPIDQSTHSLFGVSKASADLMVQEYGRYFGMNTACFRGGCLTGPHHSSTQLHGFLSHLMKCTMLGETYTVFGHKGKQVRDNIHCYDLVTAFDCFFNSPSRGAVYNIGGSRHSHCSVLEAIEHCEEVAGKRLHWTYDDRARTGDHIWYISDIGKFKRDYPQWSYRYNLESTLVDIYEAILETQRRPLIGRKHPLVSALNR